MLKYSFLLRVLSGVVNMRKVIALLQCIRASSKQRYLDLLNSLKNLSQKYWIVYS